VRIVSVNAWGGALFDELASWLRTCNADVVCLQEVTHTPGTSGWTRFDDGERALPQRASLFADVREVLPDHQALFLASDSGPIHDEHGRRLRQDFGLGTFVAEHLPVIGLHTAFVHGAFTEHDEWMIEDRPRAAQAVRVVDRVNARNITIVQLHGLRDPRGKHDTPARRAQAQRLAELITCSREPDDLTVVCGDLNLLPHSETFSVLDEMGLVDLVGESDTRTSRYRKTIRHASYLLVSDPGAVVHFETPAMPEVSDHRPLILDL
jgi:endonuclease/exonuclease/phosphatase family metal-dependent hydrolase